MDIAAYNRSAILCLASGGGQLNPEMPKEQVIIRRPMTGDCAAFLSAVRRSRTLHGSWIEPKARTPREFAEYLKRLSTDRHCGSLVIHRSSGDIMGVININDVIRGAFQSASLGYYAFAPYAGQGLMHEGLLLVLEHAFRNLKLHRLDSLKDAGLCERAFHAAS